MSMGCGRIELRESQNEHGMWKAWTRGGKTSMGFDRSGRLEA